MECPALSCSVPGSSDQPTHNAATKPSSHWSASIIGSFPEGYRPKILALGGPCTPTPQVQAGGATKLAPFRIQISPHAVFSKVGSKNASFAHAPNSLQCGPQIPYLTGSSRLCCQPQDGAVREPPQVWGVLPTPHWRWNNSFPFHLATELSHSLGLCTMPSRKAEGPSESLLGAGPRSPLFFLCLTHMLQYSLPRGQNPGQTSQAQPANNRQAPSLGRCGPSLPGRQTSPGSLCPMLHSSALGLGSLRGSETPHFPGERSL